MNYEKKLAKWRKYNQRHRVDKNKRNNNRYYKRKAEYQKETKTCDCGCGTIIPKLTAHGKPYTYLREHKPKYFSIELRTEIRGRLLKQFKDPVFQSKRLKGLCKRPTGPEKRIISVIEKYKLPYKYVGNGEFFIGSLNPDFINTNYQKRVIEVFGDYWHTLDNLLAISTEEGRRAKLKEHGYELMVLWESEINKMSDDDIHRKIKDFMHLWEVMTL